MGIDDAYSFATQRSVMIVSMVVIRWIAEGTYGKLSLLLASLDLVTHLSRAVSKVSRRQRGDSPETYSIELVTLLTLLCETWARTLTGDPIVTRGSHLAVHNSPDFLCTQD